MIVNFKIFQEFFTLCILKLQILVQASNIKFSYFREITWSLMLNKSVDPNIS